MDILKINTEPKFEIVPRIYFDTVEVLEIVLTSEKNGSAQTVDASAIILPNENYLLLLSQFPSGKENEKFSYGLFEKTSKKLLSLGRLMILAENESVQNYSKKENTKFYK